MCPSFNSKWQESSPASPCDFKTSKTATNTQTQEVFGSFTRDNNAELIGKLFKLALIHLAIVLPLLAATGILPATAIIPLSGFTWQHLGYTAILFAIFPLIPRLALRITGLVTGDWVRAGIAFGNREWMLKWQKGVQTNTPIKDLPSRCGLIVKHSLKQLAKNIAKFVTYPLVAIGVGLSALYGLTVNLNKGREMLGKCEGLAVRDSVLIPGKWDIPHLAMSEYLASCMQSQRIYERTIRVHFNIDRVRESINDIVGELNFMSQFYENEGFNTEHIMSNVLAVWNPWADLASRAKEAIRTTKTTQALAVAREREILFELDLIKTQLAQVRNERLQGIAARQYNSIPFAHKPNIQAQTPANEIFQAYCRLSQINYISF